MDLKKRENGELGGVPNGVETFEQAYTQGKAHYDNGEFDDANPLLEKALAGYLATNDEAKIDECRFYLGNMAFLKSQSDGLASRVKRQFLDRAAYYLELAYNGYCTNENHKGIALAGYPYGYCLAEFERHEEAIKVLKLALGADVAIQLMINQDSPESTDFTRIAAYSAMTLGNIYQTTGDLNLALQYYQDSYAHLEEVEDNDSQPGLLETINALRKTLGFDPASHGELIPNGVDYFDADDFDTDDGDMDMELEGDGVYDNSFGEMNGFK